MQNLQALQEEQKVSYEILVANEDDAETKNKILWLDKCIQEQSLLEWEVRQNLDSLLQRGRIKIKVHIL